MYNFPSFGNMQLRPLLRPQFLNRNQSLLPNYPPMIQTNNQWDRMDNNTGFLPNNISMQPYMPVNKMMFPVNTNYPNLHVNEMKMLNFPMNKVCFNSFCLDININFDCQNNQLETDFNNPNYFQPNCNQNLPMQNMVNSFPHLNPMQNMNDPKLSMEPMPNLSPHLQNMCLPLQKVNSPMNSMNYSMQNMNNSMPNMSPPVQNMLYPVNNMNSQQGMFSQNQQFDYNNVHCPGQRNNSTGSNFLLERPKLKPCLSFPKLNMALSPNNSAPNKQANILLKNPILLPNERPNLKISIRKNIPESSNNVNKNIPKRVVHNPVPKKQPTETNLNPNLKFVEPTNKTTPKRILMKTPPKNNPTTNSKDLLNQIDERYIQRLEERQKLREKMIKLKAEKRKLMGQVCNGNIPTKISLTPTVKQTNDVCKEQQKTPTKTPISSPYTMKSINNSITTNSNKSLNVSASTTTKNLEIKSNVTTGSPSSNITKNLPLKINTKAPIKPTNTIKITGLIAATRESAIRKTCRPYGMVESIIFSEELNGIRYALVKFEQLSAAQNFFKDSDKLVINSQSVKLSYIWFVIYIIL